MRRSAIALAALLLAAGCGTGESTREVERTAEEFASAVRSGDGRTACTLLTENAADSLERQERAPCEQAVRQLEVSGRRVAEALVYETSAQARFGTGGAVFLDETSQGWRVTAAGCEQRVSLPYECDLEG